jgi:DNA-binding transcriptional MerR regulator
MRIGELSSQTNTPVRTIRFYEERGLIPAPPRTPAGYRDYDRTAVHRLRFIRSAQAAGLTLAHIGSILAIRDEGEAPCTHTRMLLEARRAEIDDRMRELESLRAEMTRLLDDAVGVTPGRCDADAICSVIPSR